MICPRCNERPVPRVGALSRADNKTYICSDCGTHEALQQFADPEHKVVPISDWPVPHYELPQPFRPTPEHVTVDGHLYVHVAGCPCPQMQAEVARIAAQRSTDDPERWSLLDDA